MPSQSKMTEVPKFLIDYIHRNQVTLPFDVQKLILEEFHERKKYCRDDIFTLEVERYGPSGEPVSEWLQKYNYCRSRFAHVGGGPESYYMTQDFIREHSNLVGNLDLLINPFGF